MTDVAPFRERPKFLLCPRCGELLEHAFEAVLTCLRCEGLWIATVTLERAFGDPRWPRGPSMWWRNALECPECASEGQVETMNAVQAGDVVVDRCPSHGVWIDRTELHRLMGGGAGSGSDRGSVSPDLAALRARLDASDADLEQLAQRREAWRSDLGARRKAAQEYRTWLEAEHRRRQESAAALEREERERRRAREQAEAEAEAEARAKEAQARAGQAQARAAEAAERAQAEQAQARAEAERAERARTEAERARQRETEQRERQRTIQRLGDARQQASAELARLESRIIMLREQLRAAEAELDGARGRLRAIDRQLDVAQRPPG